MAEKQKAKSNPVVKNVAMIVFILAAVWFVWRNVEQRKTIAQENQGVLLLEDGQFDEARAVFEQLLANAQTEEARQRHRSNIARCYYSQAEEAIGLSVADQMELYRKAASHDPDIITNPAVRHLLERDAASANDE